MPQHCLSRDQRSQVLLMPSLKWRRFKPLTLEVAFGWLSRVLSITHLSCLDSYPRWCRVTSYQWLRFFGAMWLITHFQHGFTISQQRYHGTDKAPFIGTHLGIYVFFFVPACHAVFAVVCFIYIFCHVQFHWLMLQLYTYLLHSIYFLINTSFWVHRCECFITLIF